jgi:hypothetical protein
VQFRLGFCRAFVVSAQSACTKGRRRTTPPRGTKTAHTALPEVPIPNGVDRLDEWTTCPLLRAGRHEAAGANLCETPYQITADSF